MLVCVVRAMVMVMVMVMVVMMTMMAILVVGVSDDWWLMADV